MNTSRLFVALPIPECVSRTLIDVQSELRSLLPMGVVRFSRPETFHLTLRFLGDVKDDRISALKQSLAFVACSHKSQKLHSERLGCFSNLRFPRVIWAGVHGEGLSGLQSAVSDACGNFASKAGDKRFIGHVTLGRVHDVKRRDAEKISVVIEGFAKREFGDWEAEKFVLFRSDLSPAGGVHEELASFGLGAN